MARRAARTGNHGLTEKQEAFCRAYLENGGNGTAAHEIAFPGRYTKKQRNEEASKLLADPKISQRVHELRGELDAESVIKAKEVVRALAAVVRADILNCFDSKGRLLPLHRINPETRAALSSYEVSKKDGVVKLRFWNKNEAADKLMRYHGLYERDNAQANYNPWDEIFEYVAKNGKRGLPSVVSKSLMGERHGS